MFSFQSSPLLIKNWLTPSQPAGSLEPIMEDYNRLLVNCGRRVRVLEPEHEYDALALGIDKTGELQVECEDGSRKSVFAGEVSVRGIYGYV